MKKYVIFVRETKTNHLMRTLKSLFLPRPASMMTVVFPSAFDIDEEGEDKHGSNGDGDDPECQSDLVLHLGQTALGVNVHVFGGEDAVVGVRTTAAGRRNSATGFQSYKIDPSIKLTSMCIESFSLTLLEVAI